MGSIRFAYKRHWPAAAAVLVAVGIAVVVLRPDRTVPALLDVAEPTCPPACTIEIDTLTVASGGHVDPDALFGREVTASSVTLVPLDDPFARPTATLVADRIELTGVPPGRYELHVVATDAEVVSVTLVVDPAA